MATTMVDAGDGREFSWKDAHNATQLLVTHKETIEVEIQLEQKRKEYFERILKVEEAEDTLQQRKEAFVEQQSKFEKFMSDNELKRTRAHKRVAEELKAQQQLDSEIASKKQELEDLKNRKRQIQHTLHVNARYQNYLETVRRESEDFPTVNDILSRHETLTAANGELLTSADTYSQEVEALRAKMQELVREKATEVLLLNSKVVDYKKELESLKEQDSYNEREIFEDETTSKDRRRLYAEIGLSITDLYNRARTKNPQQRADYIEKLEAIKQKLIDMQRIISGEFVVPASKAGSYGTAKQQVVRKSDIEGNPKKAASSSAVS